MDEKSERRSRLYILQLSLLHMFNEIEFCFLYQALLHFVKLIYQNVKPKALSQGKHQGFHPVLNDIW